MESSNAALRAKNDAAADRELRELREDTLKGLRFTQELVDTSLETNTSEADSLILSHARTIIERRWPA